MFVIDIMSRRPIYEQLVDQIEKYVIGGILKAGDKIPSVRNLSVELSINPNTIQKVYTELEVKGIICSVPGRGCFISEHAKSVLDERERTRLGELGSFIRQMAYVGIEKSEIIGLIDKIYSEVSES